MKVEAGEGKTEPREGLEGSRIYIFSFFGKGVTSGNGVIPGSASDHVRCRRSKSGQLMPSLLYYHYSPWGLQNLIVESLD